MAKTVVKAAKTVIKTVKNVVKTVKNAISRPNQRIKNALVSNSSKKNSVKFTGNGYSNFYQGNKSRYSGNKISNGTKFVKTNSNGKANGIYTSFHAYAEARTSEIRQEIKRKLCSKDSERIQKQIKTGAIVAGLSIIFTSNMELQRLIEKFPNIRIEYTGTLKDSLKLSTGIAMIIGGAGLTILGGGGTVMSGGLAAEVSVPAAVAGVGVAGTGVAIAGSALSNMFDVRIQKSSKNKGSTDSNKKPTSRNQMQKQVEKGQAPKEVDRVDGAHTEGQQPHVHFKDGTSLNQDGTVHDAHKGTPNLTNSTRKWLEENGWKGN